MIEEAMKICFGFIIILLQNLLLLMMGIFTSHLADNETISLQVRIRDNISWIIRACVLSHSNSKLGIFFKINCPLGTLDTKDLLLIGCKGIIILANFVFRTQNWFYCFRSIKPKICNRQSIACWNRFKISNFCCF